jgi:hypothetical protein
MIAFLARRGTKKALTEMGVPEGLASFGSWLVWGGTVALTVDVFSIAGEAVASAGAEAIAAGADILGTGIEAAGAAGDIIGGIAEAGGALAEVVAGAVEIAAPVSVIAGEVGLEYRALLSEDRHTELSVRVLLVSANPDDDARLHLDKEFRQIRENIQKSKLRDKFTFDFYLAARPEDLVDALLNFGADVVHFSGHGTEAGCLCFENERGEVVIVNQEAIGRVFAQLSKRVRCVILNACYSAKQAKAILKHVEYVISMRREIGDKAAVAFSSGFYQGLGAGLSVEKSFEIGISAVQFGPTNQHLIPELLKREGS